MNADDLNELEAGRILAEFIGYAVAGWPLHIAKTALVANLGEVMRRECTTPDKEEQQVRALAAYMTRHLANARASGRGLFDPEAVH
jgi:hypothetical protein